jgi:hypothetical protein
MRKRKPIPQVGRWLASPPQCRHWQQTPHHQPRVSVDLASCGTPCQNSLPGPLGAMRSGMDTTSRLHADAGARKVFAGCKDPHLYHGSVASARAPASALPNLASHARADQGRPPLGLGLARCCGVSAAERICAAVGLSDDFEPKQGASLVPITGETTTWPSAQARGGYLSCWQGLADDHGASTAMGFQIKGAPLCLLAELRHHCRSLRCRGGRTTSLVASPAKSLAPGITSQADAIGVCGWGLFPFGAEHEGPIGAAA